LSGLDICLALFILLGAYHGYKAGFLLELFSLFAVILGVLCGFKLMGSVMILLAEKFDVNEKVLPYIAFIVVFLIVVSAVNLLGKLISASVNRSFLGAFDKTVGGLLGLLRTAFMFSVVLWIVDALKLSFLPNWTKGSWLYPIVADFAPTVTGWISELLPFFRDVF
jgi:membrane protein required for colicin V production